MGVEEFLRMEGIEPIEETFWYEPEDWSKIGSSRVWDLRVSDFCWITEVVEGAYLNSSLAVSVWRFKVWVPW